MSSRLPTKVSRYRDEIHGDVILDPLAVSLINTGPLQRLGRVYQLGYTHLVYRGATHTRLSHVIGAYHMAGRFVDCLRDNYRLMTDFPSGSALPTTFLPRSNTDSEPSEEARWFVLRYLVQWAALLHDVGHIPLGHTLEDEFEGIYLQHDDFRSPRLPAIWWELGTRPAEIRAVFLGADSNGLLPREFSDIGLNAEDAYAVVMTICLYKEKRETGAHSDNYKSFEALLMDSLKQTGKMALSPQQRQFVLQIQQYLSRTQRTFAPYMVDIVSNTICADYLDYIRRDTANAGLDRQTDDRVLSQFLVGEYHTAGGDIQHRMALLLTDSRGKPRLDACTGVVDLVRRRFRLAEIIYYHKTKVSASAMLAKALSLVGKPPEIFSEREAPLRIGGIAEIIASLDDGSITMESLRRRQSPGALLCPEIGDESLLVWLQERAWSAATDLFSSAGLGTRAAPADGGAQERRSTLTNLESLLRGISLLQLLERRRLYKVCAQISADGIAWLTDINGVDGQGNPEIIKQKILDVLRLRGKENGPQEERASIERAIAHAAGWPLDAILIYVPPRKSQAKGIETRALSNGSVVTLGEHPAVSEEVHALNRQYARLWRVILLVHPDYQEDDLGLSRAIDAFLRSVLDVDLAQHESQIGRIARFDYIPESQREGAELFRTLCVTDRPDWRSYLQAANTVKPDATIGPREQALRGYILSIAQDSDTTAAILQKKYGESGSIEHAVGLVAKSASLSPEALRDAISSLWNHETPDTTIGHNNVVSEAAFDSQCRRIFRPYVPAEERSRLRAVYRDFISRNRTRSPHERYALVEMLRRYDLADLTGLSTQFNREQEENIAAKLKQLERQLGHSGRTE